MIPQKSKVLISLLTLLCPAVFFFNIIQNHFYLDAPYILDSGWYADLIWHNQFDTLNPGAILDKPDDLPYFKVHFSPLFGVISAISYFTHFDRITWFSFYSGLSFGLIGLFSFLLVCGSGRVVSFGKMLLAVALSAALVWSGISMRIASYPHTEILAVTLCAAWIWAVFSSHKKLSWLFFLLALVVREDTGFHIGGLAAVVFAIHYVFKRSEQAFTAPLWSKQLLYFGVLGIAYSIFAFAVIRIYYPGADAFVRIYSGTPAYAHLTSELIAKRSYTLFIERMDITLPALFCLLCAIVTRSLMPLAGIIAFLPWLVVSFLAFSDAAGYLSLYYGFPLLIGHIFAVQTLAMLKNENLKTALLCLAIPAFIVPTYLARVEFDPFLQRGVTFVPKQQIAEVRALKNFIRDQYNVDPEMKTDIAVAALEPRVFPSSANQLHRPDPFKQTSTVIFNGHGLQVKEGDDKSVSIGAKYFYRWMNTHYIVASKVPLENVGLIRLKAAEDPTIRPSVLLTANGRS